jgi:xylulokinase
MSLIGIDVGSSAIKGAAFAADGTPLAEERAQVSAHCPQPGYWEVDPLESLAAVKATLAALAAAPALVADPPIAISFSSSGREVFPVGADGMPLGHCLMTPDIRGDDIAAAVVAQRSPREWFDLCGHVPSRFDAVNRILWWSKTDPATTAKARWFMNWHEFYALRLAGRPVANESNASTWLTYDRATGGWSSERIAEVGIDAGWLPEIQRAGTVIGGLLPEIASELGLPHNLIVVTGAWDAFAASIGAGAIGRGTVGLALGSAHALIVPADPDVSASIVEDGMSLVPYPGPTSFAVLAVNHNGTMVIDWARNITHLSISELDVELAKVGRDPGRVRGNPTFTPLGRASSSPDFGGSLKNLTFDVTSADVVRAFMEGIACGLSLMLESLRGQGLTVGDIRAHGGGAKSAWWMQLMADIFGVPVEVVTHSEPGTFGAALLAGVGTGQFTSAGEAAEALVKVSHTYAPDISRGAGYTPLLDSLA